MGKSKAASVPDRNIGKEYTNTVAAQQKVMGDVLDGEKLYAPQQTAMAGQVYNQAYGQGVAGASVFAPQLQALFDSQQQQAIAGNPLYNAMYQSAMGQIGVGGGLTPDEQIQATQGALQGLAQAGRANSNASIFNQILARSQYANQRYQQHLANAGSVYGMMPSPVGFGTVSNQLLGNSLNTATGLNNFAINPESSYAADLYNTNLNKNANMAVAQDNYKASIIGSVLGAVGKIAGGGK